MRIGTVKMASEQYRSFFPDVIFSSSSSGLLFPSEIAIPVVTNSSSGRSKDGFPLMMRISISRYRIVLVLNELFIAPHFSSVYVSKGNTIRTSNLSIKGMWNHLYTRVQNITIGMLLSIYVRVFEDSLET